MADNHSPSRIVSLQPSATVILAALDKLDLVVACTRYCGEVCPEARAGRVIVADSWTAKADEIVAVRPDLVIAAVPFQERALAQILKAGVRFLGLAPRTLANIYTDIAVIAGVAGVPDRGQQVIVEMQQGIEAVRRQTSGSERPSVFCEEWGKPLIASQPWVAELVTAAGGRFTGEAGVQRSPAAVLAEDPDILIAAWCGAGDRVPLEKVVRDRGWDEMRAVRTGRVFCISDELLNTPAPTLLSGLQALCAAIHPELFPAPVGLRRITEVRGDSREHRPRVF
ncbi:MAG TPA: ABC transporter substrate-binding protein [Terriglobales bacterium]|jgi:iron complex transport system substrate-binding protein